MTDPEQNRITVIADEKLWMEQDALDQLKNVAALPGVTRAVGLPDLHPGKIPVGIVLETQGVIYPHLIGNDVGCGMGLFETNRRVKKFRQEHFVKKLNEIESLRDIPADSPFPEKCPIIDLGTIGGGNHFAEFQLVEEVCDKEAFNAIGIDKDKILLLVHSGSRGYGERVMDEFGDYGGIEAADERAAAYMAAHDCALMWASRNRFMVAKKLTDHLGCSSELKTLIDCRHNFMERREGNAERYLHRKGAVSALLGPVVIPGSRGSFTYIAAPSGETGVSLHSLSHGAGRKWPRSLCKGRLKDKYDRSAIHETRIGSETVCHDVNLLYEEAPEAYKGIDHIMDVLVNYGL
ncbi:MAG: RNA ligase RtcB family protein, partial [Synergistaceae bacterium]|nr:RNA ligase RtcB family protein [Synergistaceae bacterium]